MEGNNGQKKIDLTNRFLESKLAGRAQRAFVWWSGGRLNKTTILIMLLIASINVYYSYPLFHKDVSSAYNSSMFVLLSSLLSDIGIIYPSLFFVIVTAIAVSFAPISVYLFVRKVAMRHELTALLATILFIFPSPFSNSLPLAFAVLNGDGAHAFVFAFVPLFLLYVQAYLSTGVFIWGVFAVFGTAAIAILSPFMLFNLLIFYVILTVAEGFLGNMRIKVARLFLLLLSAFGLSFFWYYPTVLTQIVILSHVKVTALRLLSILPLAVPAIPVVGAITFLIFDGREKLKPIFISMACFLTYLGLYFVSKTINTTGIFTPDRYILELSFSLSFFVAVIVVLLAEIAMRNYLVKMKRPALYFLAISIPSAIIGFIAIYLLYSGQYARELISKAQISSVFTLGIGNIQRIFALTPFFILASLISIFVFLALMVALFRFPLPKTPWGNKA